MVFWSPVALIFTCRLNDELLCLRSGLTRVPGVLFCGLSVNCSELLMVYLSVKLHDPSRCCLDCGPVNFLCTFAFTVYRITSFSAEFCLIFHGTNRVFWASFSWQDPCSPVMLMSPPMPCTPSTCFFLLGLWGALWYLELGRPESPGPGATWPSAQYDDPPGLHRASWQSGHSVSVCYVVSQITGTEAAGKNIL